MDEKSFKDRKAADSRNESNKDAASKDTAGKEASRKADDKPSPKAAAAKPASLAGLSSFEQLAQRKEVRIGMAVLSILVLVLGYLFVSKINEADPNPTTADAGAENDGQQPSDAGDEDPPPTVVTAVPNDYNTGHSPTTAPGHQGVYATEAPTDDDGPPGSSYLPNRSVHDHTGGDSMHHAATDAPTVEQLMDPTDESGSKYSKYLDSPSGDHVAEVPASDAAAGQNKYADGDAANGVGSKYADNGTNATDTRSDIKSVPLEPTEVPADQVVAHGEQSNGGQAHNDQRHGLPIADATLQENGATAKGTDAAAVAQANEAPESHIADVDSAHAHSTTTQPEPHAAKQHAPVATDAVVEVAPVEQPAVARPVAEPSVSHEKTITSGDVAADRVANADNSTARPQPANRTYVTLDGDSAATIAKRVYGDAALGAALLAFNGAELPADEPLAAGGEVLIPQRQILAQAFPQLMPRAAQPSEVSAPRAIAPTHPSTPAAEQDTAVAVADNVPPAEQRRADASNSRIYEVARGETVYDIARKELGRVSRWREILELNAEQLGGDIDAIEPGMRLRLPDEGRSAVARQRGELLWR